MMSQVRSAAVWLPSLPLVVAIWLVLASPVWAQTQPQMGAANKSYVLPYILVILVTALGLLVVLRPSPRKSGSRPKAEG